MQYSDFQILLYYKYVAVEDPQALVDEQRELCQSLGLKGRILIAHEGINGTVEGTREATEKYARTLLADPRFHDVTIKRSAGTGSAFKKLFVRLRREIVSSHLGERDIDPRITTGVYLSAEDLHSWFAAGKKFFIVDMRNDYEFEIGHFAGSVLPPLKNFRNLTDVLPHLEHLRGETIVTVCTGGVRCEKASGFLVANGFNNVHQLKDGIVTYMEKFPNEDFRGKLYVFDGRIAIGFNTEDPKHEIISNCEYCGKKSDHYNNCSNDPCHRQFISCESCVQEGRTTCPPEHGCVFKHPIKPKK